MVNVLGGGILESLLTEAAPAQNLNPPEEAPTQGKEPMPPMPGTLSIATLSKYKEGHTACRGWRRHRLESSKPERDLGLGLGLGRCLGLSVGNGRRYATASSSPRRSSRNSCSRNAGKAANKIRASSYTEYGGDAA